MGLTRLQADMTGTAVAYSRLHLLALSLLWCSRVSGSDIHTLYYNFTIIPKQPYLVQWCEAKGQIDRHTFPTYDCASKKVEMPDSQDKEMDVIKTWTQHVKTLSELLEFLRMNMFAISDTVNSGEKGPMFFQGRMTCQREANGVTHGSWQFGFDAQMSLIFNSEEGDWRHVKPEGVWIKEILDKDRNVTALLKKTSGAHCKTWLEEVLDKIQEETDNNASNNMTHSASPSKSTDITLVTWIFPVILSCLVTFFTQGGAFQTDRVLVPPRSP